MRVVSYVHFYYSRSYSLPLVLKCVEYLGNCNCAAVMVKLGSNMLTLFGSRRDRWLSPFTADPLPGTLAPSEGACKDQSVSKTLFNVTLIAGIKSGTFTDKGLVRDMAECSSHCCSEDTCNVAFLIRDNCFLVACQDYESCHVKPALSEYYHPRLAYVNWSPPDQEIPSELFDRIRVTTIKK